MAGMPSVHHHVLVPGARRMLQPSLLEPLEEPGALEEPPGTVPVPAMPALGAPLAPVEAGEPALPFELGEPPVPFEPGEPAVPVEAGEPAVPVEAGEPAVPAALGEPPIAGAPALALDVPPFAGAPPDPAVPLVAPPEPPGIAPAGPIALSA